MADAAPAPVDWQRLRLVAFPVVAMLLLACCSSEAPAPDRTKPAQAAGKDGLAFTGFVVDRAGLLDARQRDALTRQLDRFQQATGHQLVVVTVPSLGGAEIAGFATRLANRWSIGRRSINDGILLLVALRERQVRIAVGLGLNKQLTDPACAAILRQHVLPAFGRGDMAGGIAAGVTALIARLDARDGTTRRAGD